MKYLDPCKGPACVPVRGGSSLVTMWVVQSCLSEAFSACSPTGVLAIFKPRHIRVELYGAAEMVPAFSPRSQIYLFRQTRAFLLLVMQQPSTSQQTGVPYSGGPLLAQDAYVSKD